MVIRDSRDLSLCFCEYDNIKGERSHLLATFCDCEAVDSICDNILSCQAIPQEKMENLLETIEDRIRIPYLGGAIRIKMDVHLTYVLFCLFLYIGTLGFWWTIISVFMSVFTLYYIEKICSSRRKSQVCYSTMKAFFVVYTLIFMIFVFGFRKVLLWEALLLWTSFLVTLWFLLRTRQDPGDVRNGDVRNGEVRNGEMRNGDVRNCVEVEADSSVMQASFTYIDSRFCDGLIYLYCDECKVNKPQRSGHCPLCQKCISGRDHHCKWIDNCIGQYNHKNFFLFLVFLLITTIYWTHLTATTICTPEIYLDWFLFVSDCRFVYSDFPTALCMSSIIFICFGISFMSLIFFQQLIYISQNITGLEMVKARKMGKSRYWLFASGNVNNRGFLKNWSDFLLDRRKQEYSQAQSMN